MDDKSNHIQFIFIAMNNRSAVLFRFRHFQHLHGVMVQNIGMQVCNSSILLWPSQSMQMLTYSS